MVNYGVIEGDYTNKKQNEDKTMNTNRTEQWKTIKGYEGKYEISNMGRIRNLNWNGTGEVRVIAQHINPMTGYIQVGLYSKETGKSKMMYLHRLVADAFLPNPNNLEQVDHIDGNKSNNKLSNIRWCSRKFNNSRKLAKKLKSANHNSTSHIHQFVKAEKDGQVLYFKNGNKTAQGLGCSHVLVIKALRGEINLAKGWKLSYIDRGSEEGKNSNVDLTLKSTIRRIEKIDKRKEHKANRNILKQHLLLDRMMDYYSEKARGETPEFNITEIREQVNADIRAIVQYDKNGNEIAIWKNAYEAVKTLGINGIYDAIHKLKDEAGGFIWRYKIED